jgi:hypothetical protein
MDPRLRGDDGIIDRRVNEPDRRSPRQSEPREQSPRLRQMRRIHHPAIHRKHPSVGIGRERATTARACAISASLGLNPALIAATCAGWIAIIPVNPSRRPRAT